MTDDSMRPAAAAAEAGASEQPAKPSGLKGFLSTTLGKVLVIFLAVSTLLTVLAVVAVIVLGGIGVSMLGDLVTEQTPGSVPASGTSAPAAQPTDTVKPVATVALSEVFVPRDPFMRVVMPASALTTGETTDENTLTLMDIIEDNGVRKAVLQLGANSYTLAAGEVISGTPWQVVSVDTASVIMLYGDSQISLSLGQGISVK